MRKPFERLVVELAALKDTSKTLGELAKEHDCSPERISDALDTVKLLRLLSEMPKDPGSLISTIIEFGPLTYISVKEPTP